MLDQIKGLPVATESDAGKSVIVNESGEYALGEGSGGGGANVLTLYVGSRDGDPWAYKDPAHTVEYETLEEAKSALNGADIIKLYTQRGFAFPSTVVTTAEVACVNVCDIATDSVTGIRVYLFNTHTT